MTIASEFNQLHMERNQHLERSRYFALMSNPAILPYEHQSPNQSLPMSYQDDARIGVANMASKGLAATVPTDIPWVHFEMSIVDMIGMTPEDREQAEADYYLASQIALAKLYQTSVGDSSSKSGEFQVRQYNAWQHMLITGNVLQTLDEKCRVRNWRLDSWVCQRDGCGDAVLMITKQRVDPLSLTEEVQRRAGFDSKRMAEFREQRIDRRLQDHYTKCEMDHATGDWHVTEEINDEIVNDAHESVAPMWIATLDMIEGEHYGRGYLERFEYTIEMVDELELRTRNAAALASWFRMAIDSGSNVTDEALTTGRVGSPLRNARVDGGSVLDIAPLQLARYADFRVFSDILSAKREELNRYFLVVSQVLPQQERVTATQVSSITQELNSALGGTYASVAEKMQIPLIKRLVWQLDKDGVFKKALSRNTKFNPDKMETKITSGIAALSITNEAQEVIEAFQLAQGMGPEALDYIDVEAAFKTILRKNGSAGVEIVRSNDEVEQIRQQRVQQQAALQAQQSITQGAVDATVNAAAQQPQGTA